MERVDPAKRANVWTFFAATYAASWLIWLPPIAWRGEQPNLLLVVLGAFVPSVMGIIFTYLTHDRAGRREFWRRTIDPRRIGWRWLAVITLVFPAMHALTMAAYTLLGGSPPSPAEAVRTLVNPGLMLQIVLLDVVIVAGWGARTLTGRRQPAASRQASSAQALGGR